MWVPFKKQEVSLNQFAILGRRRKKKERKKEEKPRGSVWLVEVNAILEKRRRRHAL